MIQVLNNLVSNAIRYTLEGGSVIVSIGEQAAEGRRWATITVADTGMGIPASEMPHIFDRFFRGKRPREMQLTGTGLGLSIVQEIVQYHGGQVEVESEENAGSIFTVWLPLADQGA
jgi:two-component system sensor histidine kinase VicK